MTAAAHRPPRAARARVWVERDGLLWSPALQRRGLVAGFTTRAQGSMAGSVHPLDEQAANRAALARRLGFPAVTRMKQVHGREVARVDGPGEVWPVADAMWTDAPNVLLGVAAADCVPVLVADGDGRLGVAHAGWEGTTEGVAAALVEAMAADGAGADRLVAALGPSIGPCCYAVGAERAVVIAERIGDADLVRDGDRTVFDLWSANERQLRAAGLREIEVAGICTCSGGADLWSYRGRDPDGRYGTQLGFLGRRGA